MAKQFTRIQIKKMPHYVSLNGIALRLYNPEQQGFFGWNSMLREYYRDAGIWSVDIRIDETSVWSLYKLFSISDMPNLHDVELIPISYQVWRKDNEGNIDKKTKAHGAEEC